MSNTQRRRRAERHTGQPQEIYADQALRLQENIPQEPAGEAAVPRPLVATNTGVRLACTMAAMIGLFALFLCHAEKESRVIRRFSVQSAALTAVHAVLAAAALLLSSLLGAVPYLGLMVSLMCLLGYMSGLIVLIVLRFRMMEHAWQGVRFSLPRMLEKQIQRYYWTEGNHAS